MYSPTLGSYHPDHTAHRLPMDSPTLGSYHPDHTAHRLPMDSPTLWTAFRGDSHSQHSPTTPHALPLDFPSGLPTASSWVLFARTNKAPAEFASTISTTEHRRPTSSVYSNDGHPTSSVNSSYHQSRPPSSVYSAEVPSFPRHRVDAKTAALPGRSLRSGAPQHHYLATNEEYQGFPDGSTEQLDPLQDDHQKLKDLEVYRDQMRQQTVLGQALTTFADKGVELRKLQELMKEIEAGMSGLSVTLHGTNALKHAERFNRLSKVIRGDRARLSSLESTGPTSGAASNRHQALPQVASAYLHPVIRARPLVPRPEALPRRAMSRIRRNGPNDVSTPSAEHHPQSRGLSRVRVTQQAGGGRIRNVLRKKA
ncbi:hypothetical protein OIO90_004709 [Microbotryomycetes sp. JL221]|nr:hypothetical protein OIO90_004709 [Microbotryomycetes sp. JL221]